MYCFEYPAEDLDSERFCKETCLFIFVLKKKVIPVVLNLINVHSINKDFLYTTGKSPIFAVDKVCQTADIEKTEIKKSK